METRKHARGQFDRTAAYTLTNLAYWLGSLYHHRSYDRVQAFVVRDEAKGTLSRALCSWINRAVDVDRLAQFGTPADRLGLLGDLSSRYEVAVYQVDELFRAWFRGAWPDRSEDAPLPVDQLSAFGPYGGSLSRALAAQDDQTTTTPRKEVTR